MKQVIILLGTLFFSIFSSAQKPPIKWKEIPIEDLRMKSYPLDTSASAVVLCDYGQYYFDINPNGNNLYLFNKRHIRIKILKEAGLKYSKMKIPFINMTCEQYHEENGIVIKGMTYNLSETGKLEASRLKRKTIIYKDTTNCRRIAEVELPDVKVGSVIDYYYEQPTWDFISPKSWNFQCEIPIRHSEFRMRVPRYFEYVFSPVNFDGFDIAQESHYSTSLLYSPRYYRYRGTYHYDMSGKQLQFVKLNIEAAKSKGFLYYPENYIKKLNIHLFHATNQNLGYIWKRLTHSLFITTVDGYENYEPIQRKSIIYPAGYIIYKLHDWEKVTNDLLKSSRFGLPLIKHWDYKQHLDSIIKGKTSDLDKLQAIYNYIRRNIKWNGKNSMYVNSVFSPGLSKLYTKITKKMFIEKSLKRPFDAKEGTSSEINFILISLLNRANIETKPVIISTRDNGLVDSEIPDPKQFNHVLALAKVGDKEILLDATDSLRPYSLLAKNHLTTSAFLVDNKDFGWFEIKNNQQTITKINERVSIKSDFNVKQSFTIIKKGYHALEQRKKISQRGSEALKEVAKLYNLDKIDSVKNLKKDIYPLILTSQLTSRFIDNELIIRPKIIPGFDQNDFTDFIRQFPVEFKYPYKKTYTLEIDLIEGLEFILPKNESFNTYGNNAFFSYTSNQQGDKIRLNIDLEIKLTSYPNTEYSNIEQLFVRLNEKINEKIVIRKKSS